MSNETLDIFNMILWFVRLFNFKMYELRRGVNDAKTFSINFSMDSSLLCSISSRGTCHIWKLDDSDERKSKFIEGKRSISQIQIPDFNSKLQSKKIKYCVGGF